MMLLFIAAIVVLVVLAVRWLGGSGGAARRAPLSKAVDKPPAVQGGNTNIVVRGDPGTGDRSASSSTAGAVPDGLRGRSRRCWPMLELCVERENHARF